MLKKCMTDITNTKKTLTQFKEVYDDEYAKQDKSGNPTNNTSNRINNTTNRPVCDVYVCVCVKTCNKISL